MANRKSNESFFYDNGVVIENGRSRKIILDEKRQTYEGYPGLSWQTYTYEGINQTEEDGALCELQPGCRTPIEMVVTDKTFMEIPIEGRLTLLAVDPQGNVYEDNFNGKPEDGSTAMIMEKGWIFVWFVSKNQIKPSYILETERPGFSDGDFQFPPHHSSNFNGQPIPKLFWDKFDRLTRELLINIKHSLL